MIESVSQSVAEAKLSEFLLGCLHDHHRRAVSCEDAHGAGQDTPVYTEKPVRSDDAPALFKVGPAELVSLFSLDLVLKELKGPDEPEGGRRHEASGKELSLLGVHEARVASTQIEHANETTQKPDVARQNHPEPFVHFIVLPGLVRLAPHLAVFEWALDKRAEDACADAARHRAQLDAASSWNGCHHQLVAFESSVKHLGDCELGRPVDN